MKSGSDCPCGVGWFTVYRSLPILNGYRVRYVRCWCCGLTAKETVKAAPPRKRCLLDSSNRPAIHTGNVG
jgi:hypothetical protein